MDIVIGEIRSPDSDDGGHDSGSVYSKNRKQCRERRKNRYDRRKSVRDGIDVSFSYQNDRWLWLDLANSTSNCE